MRVTVQAPPSGDTTEFQLPKKGPFLYHSAAESDNLDRLSRLYDNILRPA